MINRRNFLKTAAVGGSGLLGSVSSFASQKRTARKGSIDFQTSLPRLFDEKPFGPEDLAALEDEAGIDRFVVFPEATPRPDNLGLAKRIRSNPRIIGGAAANPTLGNEAVAELERAVKDMGLKGVRLSPVAHGYPIDGEMVYPLLEKVRELGVPVTVENGDAENCRPSRIAVIAGRFPEVPIILDMSFRAPIYVYGPGRRSEMADVMQKCPNLYLGLTSLTTCQPPYLAASVSIGGPNRVVFGSYAPSGVPLFAMRGIELAGLGPEAEALIFGGNLREVYKLV
ncbi:MAG: amidohydrolase family protein [Candidatus Latescibacterota bacterium]